jgi:Leucine-rich repeat (LRR) protein
LRSAVFESPA